MVLKEYTVFKKLLFCASGGKIIEIDKIVAGHILEIKDGYNIGHFDTSDDEQRQHAENILNRCFSSDSKTKLIEKKVKHVSRTTQDGEKIGYWELFLCWFEEEDLLNKL